MNDPLLPVEGCWVCLRSELKRLGLVQRRRPEGTNWLIEVRWPDGTAEWLPLGTLQCGVQPGWVVQDVPTSAVRQPLGLGLTAQRRLLGGREQILVQWHDSGRSTWMPYENLRRVKDPELRFQRQDLQHKGSAERFRLRVLSYALENWNQLTGSLDRLDIDPLPHQIQLVHRIISSGNTNWLIADDVGLGKTIEVGLLLAALKRKGHARRVLVVAPAGLTRQWRDEMQYKFNQIYRIYGLDFIEEDPVRWKGYDHVIVSLDLAKREEHLAHLRAAGAWDVVIFDEGHRLTRHGDGERSERYRLAEALRGQADAFLLLSGTPHQGYTDRFKGLLQLVRPDLKPQIDTLEANPELVGEMILRNRKSTVTDAEGNLIFRGHEVHRVSVNPSKTTLRLQNMLSDYLRRGYKAGEQGGAAGRAIGFVMVTYRKLASSSVAAIERALQARLGRLTSSLGRPADEERPIEDLFEGGDDQDDIGDFSATPRFFVDEENMLRDLIATAARVRQVDEKLEMFLSQVAVPLLDQGKRLLVFTEYRATQTYLQEALVERFPGHEVALINGSMTLAAKLDAIQAFQEEATFLVSTEAGGEGINLQASCHVMVNYDLPWNPARLVQRIGRLYRYGQKEKVIVFNLHASDSFDNQAVSLMLDRVLTVAREMAPVGAEFSDQLYSEILGELLENLDMAAILQRATDGRDSQTRDEIDAAIARAQEAKKLQDELLSYASGFDPNGLRGALGLSMKDVGSFITLILPFVDIFVDTTAHDGRVLDLRLPEALRGYFPEFHQRTVVRVTTDRSLAQRLRDVVLLDFENSFFQYLMRFAQHPDFGGSYAIARASRASSGVLTAFRLRWQNDQGDPVVEEFLVAHADQQGQVDTNPPYITDWLRQPIGDATTAGMDRAQRSAVLANIKVRMEQRLGEESTRFKHPNGLVLLAVADVSDQ
jgi:superfamily II DNA or RNA helicase